MTASVDLSALAEEVRTASAARARAAHLDAQLEAADALVLARRSEVEELQRQHSIEQADVRRLEGLSPTRLWATLRGSAEEQLAKEKAEADAAGRAVVAAQRRLDHALADARRLSDERAALGNVIQPHQRAVAAFEAGLRAAGGVAGFELTHLSDELGRVTEEIREIDEASQALQVARTSLTEAYGRLESAGGWSTYDTFFGGGFVADLVKHTRIDEATQAFVKVNRALERLSNELADIDAPPLRGVDISETLTVFDILFDNFFSDWMVRERIAEAKNEAARLAGALEALVPYLSDRASVAARRAADLSFQREKVLADAMRDAAPSA